MRSISMSPKNVKKHIFHHNSAPNHRSNFWIGVKCSKKHCPSNTLCPIKLRIYNFYAILRHNDVIISKFLILQIFQLLFIYLKDGDIPNKISKFSSNRMKTVAMTFLMVTLDDLEGSNGNFSSS